MEYIEALDVKAKMEHIAEILGMEHVDLSRMACFRSKGTSTRNTIARCHGLSKIIQLGMNVNAFYAIEVISEKFDRLNEEEQIKVIIHELMHIPKNFGGGFRHHDYVCRKEVERMYKLYRERCRNNGF